jgi:hypothetical protein
LFQVWSVECRIRVCLFEFLGRQMSNVIHEV